MPQISRYLAVFIDPAIFSHFPSKTMHFPCLKGHVSRMGGVVTKEKSLIDELREEFQKRIEEFQALERNTEPLDLVSLPPELIHKIVDKLDYTDFIQLERCSLATENILNSRSFSLKHFVPTIYVNKKSVKISNEYEYYTSEWPRIPWHVATAHEARVKADAVTIAHRATSGRIQAVAKLFERNKTTADVLTINEHILFAAEDLHRLMTVLKNSHLDCRQFMPREFFAHHCLENLSSMTLYTTGCTDEELLHIKQDVLYMTNDFVTAKGLNKFLKQWKQGKRNMVVVDIEFDTSFNTRNFDIILEGLDANPVWTPDLHEHSVVRGIKLEEYYPMTTSDPEHVYSIFQKGDVTQFRMVRLSMGRFEVFSVDSEAEFMMSYLDMDQYYLITGICPLCAEWYCSHRRLFSTQRFKKTFPRLNSAIITGFKIASTIIAAARCSQMLLGAPLPPVPLTKEQIARMEYEDGVGNNKWKKKYFNLRLYLFNYL